MMYHYTTATVFLFLEAIDCFIATALDASANTSAEAAHLEVAAFLLLRNGATSAESLFVVFRLQVERSYLLARSNSSLRQPF